MGTYEGTYYLGLDVGTDSVGYAVTDENYHVLDFRGRAMWGADYLKKLIPQKHVGWREQIEEGCKGGNGELSFCKNCSRRRYVK